MEVSRAIDLIDDKMCWGRGTFSAHHMPERDEYWQAGEMAIEALKKQEENRWIPVAEKFPEDDCECRVTVKGDLYKWVGTCSWNKYNKCFEEWNAYSDSMKSVVGVIAWKPIEEPYAEEE